MFNMVKLTEKTALVSTGKKHGKKLMWNLMENQIIYSLILGDRGIENEAHGNYAKRPLPETITSLPGSRSIHADRTITCRADHNGV